MRRTRLTIIFLLPFLCVFATTPRSSSSQKQPLKHVDPATSIEFTVETGDKEPRFFEPLHLQVLLRNNSAATHSLDLGKLRLRPAGWWGSSGVGSGLVEDIPLALDDNQQQQVVLTAHGSLMLSGVDSETTLATRATEPGRDRINSVDWIDDQTLIFDRHQLEGEFTWLNPRSSLRRLSLAQW